MAGKRSFWSLVEPDQTVAVCVTSEDFGFVILSLLSDITVVFKSAEGVFEILYCKACPVFDLQDIYVLSEIGFRFRPDGRSLESVAEPGRVFTAQDALKVFDEIFGHCLLSDDLPSNNQPSLYSLLRRGGFPN